MAQPTQKSFAMESALRDMFGFDRGIHIIANQCVPSPVGCGGVAISFTDEQSEREYHISGLCQKCQDRIFSS
jgi:hypothetical protein